LVLFGELAGDRSGWKQVARDFGLDDRALSALKKMLGAKPGDPLNSVRDRSIDSTIASHLLDAYERGASMGAHPLEPHQNLFRQLCADSAGRRSGTATAGVLEEGLRSWTPDLESVARRVSLPLVDLDQTLWRYENPHPRAFSGRVTFPNYLYILHEGEVLFGKRYRVENPETKAALLRELTFHRRIDALDPHRPIAPCLRFLTVCEEGEWVVVQERIAPSLFLSDSKFEGNEARLVHLDEARKASPEVKQKWIERLTEIVAMLDKGRIRCRDMQILLQHDEEGHADVRLIDFDRYLDVSKAPSGSKTNRQCAQVIIDRLLMPDAQYERWSKRYRRAAPSEPRELNRSSQS
jgi:hypothetical protein